MVQGERFGKCCAPTTAILTTAEITEDTLTERGGLTLFSRYLRGTGIFAHLECLFGALRRSGKGLPVSALFHQLFCFLLDATSRHLVYFDTLKIDEGYARGDRDGARADGLLARAQALLRRVRVGEDLDVSPPAADSGALRPLIPIDSGQAFQSIPATHSGAFRSDIPADSGHPGTARSRQVSERHWRTST